MSKPFNPWPVAIGVIYGGFALVMIGFVAWSTRDPIDLVAPDYYDREIAYQQEIDALERSLPYASQVRWNRPDGGLEIAVAEPLRAELTHAVLRFYRPSDSALDQDVPVALDAEGRFVVDTSPMRGGFWRTRLEWRHADLEYAIETSLHLHPPERTPGQ